MKKKLTRNSFSALRKIATVLDEQQQRAVVGGDYWDDHGIWQIDSNGNSYWTRTSQGDQYYGGSGYGGGSGYYGGSGYGGNSGYETNSGVITQEQFFNWAGDWPGGYVEGMGYVPPDTLTYGVSGGHNTTYNGNSSTTSSYYSSSGDYSRSRNNEWYDSIANQLIGAIPIVGSLTSTRKEYIDNKINDAIGALLDIGHSGPIIVRSTYGTPSSTTDISIQIKIYDGGWNLLYDSN